MHGKDALKTVLTSTQGLLGMYLSDLSDADLLVRPVAGANHIAWQLGHLIHSEHHLVKLHVPGAVFPELPAGFAEQHNKETAAVEPPSGYRTKSEYLTLFNQARAATLASLDRLADADLDKPTSGLLSQRAPTVAAMLVLVSNHTLMHAGQFTVIRRKLGKPVLF